jgi:hypothetical protein
LIALAKNKNMFFKGKGMDHGKRVGTQPKAAGVNCTLLPWFSLLLHCVKYEQETTI